MYKGECHLCLKTEELTFEHIPPRKAHNNEKSESYIALDSILREDHEPWDFEDLQPHIQQQGVGYYSLCENCNNNTGSWYGKSFIEFTDQGIQALQGTYAEETFTTVKYQKIYPLRIIKQIFAMFASINPPGVINKKNKLQQFVLDKNSLLDLGNSNNIYAYLTRGPISRLVPFSATIYSNKEIIVASEISYPPYGFIWAKESSNLIKGFNISKWASNYNYNDKINLPIELPIFECNIAMPMDFRTKQEILNCIEENKKRLQTKSSRG